MKRIRSLGPLTALATLLAAGAAHGAEWHYVNDNSPAGIKAESPREAATAYLAHAAGELRLASVALDPTDDLEGGAFHTVRFMQTYGDAGLPVLGTGAAVRTGADGRVQLVVLDVARDLSVSPVPAVDDAAAVATADLKLAQVLGLEMDDTPMVGLAVLPQVEGPGRLVWIVDALRSSPRAMRVLVDAHTGEFLRFRPLTTDVLGRVYPISDVSTPNTQDLTLQNLVVSSPQYLNGWSGNLTVTNYVSGSPTNGLNVTQSLTPNSGPDFLYNPPANPLSLGDGFAQVMLYYHLTRARNYYAGTLGVNLSPSSWKLTAVANAADGNTYLDNAYFSEDGITGAYASPNLIVIGQGSQSDFAVDSDVFIHEFGHYVTHNAVGYNQGQLAFGTYGLTPWAGAVDEGISDYFACTLNDDPILGESSLAPFQAERDLTDTSRICPNDTIGEVHEDGNFINSLGWSARQSFGPAIADQLVWGAVTLMTPGASLTDFAEGMQATASNLVASGQMTSQQSQTLTNIIAARGLDDCGHVLDVSATKSRTFYDLGLTVFGSLLGLSCNGIKQYVWGLHSLFHFRATPAPGDDSLRFTVDLTPVQGSGLNWGIYVRAVAPVTISDQDLSPQTFTWSKQNITTGHGELLIDGSSNPPFDPSKTYYMVIGDQSCALTHVSVKSSSSGTTSTSSSSSASTGAGGAGQGGSDAGVGGGASSGGGKNRNSDSGESSGCACRIADDQSGTTPLVLAAMGFAGAGLLRRRRRRSAAR